MKRFHVHVHVADLAQSVAFYSKLFAAEPTRSEADYAKWMLDDPRINFAISTRGGAVGVDHLGVRLGSRARGVRPRHDELLLRTQREALGNRSAGRRLGALPHAARHPGVQRFSAARHCCGDARRCGRRVLSICAGAARQAGRRSGAKRRRGG
jgi:hypothetical protein